MLYRVNYGNGQVSETFKRRADADRHLASLTEYRGYAFVEFYDAGTADDPGDWFPARRKREA